MPVQNHEPSLRNEHVGQAYMCMLEIRDDGAKQGLTPSQICERIQKQCPWAPDLGWPYQAWCIAARLFCSEFGLPECEYPAAPQAASHR